MKEKIVGFDFDFDLSLNTFIVDDNSYTGSNLDLDILKGSYNSVLPDHELKVLQDDTILVLFSAKTGNSSNIKLLGRRYDRNFNLLNDTFTIYTNSNDYYSFVVIDIVLSSNHFVICYSYGFLART